MMREYTEDYYLPLEAAYQQRCTEVGVQLQDWHHQLTQHWSRIHFGDVTSSKTESGHHFEVQVYLDDLPADAVSVELFANPGSEAGQSFCQPLERGEPLAGTTGAYTYRGTVPADRPVMDYTPRIIPAHANALVPLEANFILWYQ
jgi:starch phosphorylase